MKLSDNSYLIMGEIPRTIVEYKDLKDLKPKQKEEIKIYGKSVETPRFTVNYL